MDEREIVIDKEVGSLSLDYFEGCPKLSVDEKRFPDVVPEIIRRCISNREGGRTVIDLIPYCGRGRFAQSSLEFSDESYSELSSDSTLRPMLCLVFSYDRLQRSYGTLSNYNLQGQKLWDYSLMFNGEDGIFERFWRQRDNLLRNALLEVKYDLLLSEKHKFTLSPLEKVMLNNQEYLISEMKYTPEQRDIKSCHFLSVRQQPNENNELSRAKTEADYFPANPFRWVFRSQRNFTINNPNNSTPAVRFLERGTDFFPPRPTQEHFSQGGRHFEQQHKVEFGWHVGNSINMTVQGEGTVSTWLEAVRA